MCVISYVAVDEHHHFHVCVLGSVFPHSVTGSALSNSTCDWLTAPTEAKQG